MYKSRREISGDKKVITLEEAKEKWPEIEIGKAQDIRGQKFNKLLPVYRTLNQGSQTRFVCLCDCGEYTRQDAYQIKHGTTKSCGCWKGERLSTDIEFQRKAGQARGKQIEVDYEGQTIGLLTFYKTEEQDLRNNHLWRAVCVCGNERLIPACDIGARIKKTKGPLSCGCYQYKELHLENQRFGKLIAIKNTKKQTNSGNYIWECQCDCGNKAFVPGSALVSGNTQSCGCQTSRNEAYIKSLLEERNINFIYQYYCKEHKKRFDFFIENKYIIEYDGEQHFFWRESGWNNEDNYKITHQSDLLKNQYCFEHNIPLIRIPYDADYTAGDLFLETTRFLLTPDNEEEYYSQRSK